MIGCFRLSRFWKLKGKNQLDKRPKNTLKKIE
jgi:hypothetical protein